MTLIEGMTQLGLLAESLEMALFEWFQLDLFDLLFVITAVVFNIQVMGIYIAGKQRQVTVVRRLGMAVIALALPFGIVFLNDLINGAARWMLFGLALILLYLFIELLADFILKFEFRSRPVFHIPYIIMFYMVEIALIRIAFSISSVAGYLVSVSFWLLLACLLYALWPGRETDLLRGKQ